MAEAARLVEHSRDGVVGYFAVMLRWTWFFVAGKGQKRHTRNRKLVRLA